MRRWLSVPRAYTAPDDGGLSSFRTSCLAVVMRARVAKLASSRLAMAPNNQGGESSPPSVDMNLPVLLFADDLVRGYRVDIFDKTKASTAVWRSLCKRIGTYSFPNSSHTPLRIPDEGYVKGATASSTVNGATDSDLYLPKTLFQWERSRLCPPPPA